MSELKALLATVKKSVAPYFTHLAAEATALLVVATHDVDKVETAAAAAGALALASAIKRISAWLG